MTFEGTGTEVLYKTEKSKVVAFYKHGELQWTTTYVYDDEGYVEKMVRVYNDGMVSVQ